MSQLAEIRRDLKRGKRISALSALEDYNCFRLSGRIYDLKQSGVPIGKEMVHDRRSGKTYAVYWLAKGRKAA